MKVTDPFRKKLKPRYCRVGLTEDKSAPYHIEFNAYYRGRFDHVGELHGTKITVATHRCRYSELQNIIDTWIDQAKLPKET
ncbi:MAG: hypothetical protein OXH31_09795 [Gammaproteobacteria bacterium]|nr:hypothetical protein [Gammaproteobacteria bacterium]